MSIMEEEKRDKLRLPHFEESDSPWLLYTHGSSKRKKVQTFYNLSETSNRTSYIKSIPQLRNKSILDSIDGWLILRDVIQLDMFSIFNLFSLHTILLPPLQAPDNQGGNLVCGLKSTLDCHDCLLLVCFTKARIMFSCRPAQPNCCWITHQIELEDSDSSVSNICDIFCVNGVMYVSNSDRMSNNLLYEVDDSSSLILKPLQIRAPDFLPALGFPFVYMVESCNRIYFVVIILSSYVKNFDLEYIKVFELDIKGRCWKEIKSLNGRSFFLGLSGCTWCWGTTNESGSKDGIQKDGIYFHIPFPATPHFNIYNLHDASFLPIQPCPNLISPNEYPVFVIPQHLRLPKVERSNEKLKEVNINCQWVGGIEHKNLELSQQKLRKESKLSELPLHIVEKISKHIHLFDYYNFRATSKMFKSICPAPKWRTNNILPLLLSFKNSGSCQLVDPCRHDSCFHVVPFFQDRFNIRFSKNGWILAVVGKSLQYVNIFTGMRGDYPDPPVLEDLFLHFRSIAFSTYPTCSECLTIGTVVTDDGLNIVYHESGKGAWNHCRFQVEDDKDDVFDPCNSCPIFLAGAFYILDKQGRLGVFQLVNGETRWQMYAKPHNLKKFYTSHLVECMGELYSVFIKKMGKRIQVFKFDKLLKQWAQIQYLENHVFFVSRASSISIVTKDRSMKNRIYFPRLYKKGVIFYSQDTQNYHSLASNYIIEDFCGTSEPLHCCWI